MTTETYRSTFDASWDDYTPVRCVRFVVLDTETTGFDLQRDRIITIGAVAVRDGELHLDDTCELMLTIAHNLASVTIHGITRDEARDGMDEAQAIEVFLGYLRDAVIVGHHIGHDIGFLNHACERHFGFGLQNRSLDTMDLSLRLSEDGALTSLPLAEGFSLDSLCEMFAVTPHDRHTAGGRCFPDRTGRPVVVLLQGRWT
jgi:DNA polymerase-3 subunit epsilon